MPVCGRRFASFPLSIPPSVAGAGPSLTFYYKAPAFDASRAGVVRGLGVLRQSGSGRQLHTGPALPRSDHQRADHGGRDSDLIGNQSNCTSSILSIRSGSTISPWGRARAVPRLNRRDTSWAFHSRSPAVGLLLGLSFAVTVTGCASRSVIGEQNGVGAPPAIDHHRAGWRRRAAGGSGGSAGDGAGTGGAGRARRRRPGRRGRRRTASHLPGLRRARQLRGTGRRRLLRLRRGLRDSAGACAWDTVPQDPGFQNMPAGAWKLEQGAMLNATAGGNIEPGELELASRRSAPRAGAPVRRSRCRPSPTPSLSRSRWPRTATARAMRAPAARPARRWSSTAAPTCSTTRPLDDSLGCLGERAYGGTFDVVVRPSSRTLHGGDDVDAIVDHLDIEPSTTCPMPGTLPDGNFDAATNNWTTCPADEATGRPTRRDPGGNGDRVARRPPEHRESARRPGHGPISPPLSSIPNLALQLSYKGTTGEAEPQSRRDPDRDASGHGRQLTARLPARDEQGDDAGALFGLVPSAGRRGGGAHRARTSVRRSPVRHRRDLPGDGLGPRRRLRRADPATRWTRPSRTTASPPAPPRGSTRPRRTPTAARARSSSPTTSDAATRPPRSRFDSPLGRASGPR